MQSLDMWRNACREALKDILASRAPEIVATRIEQLGGAHRTVAAQSIFEPLDNVARFHEPGRRLETQTVPLARQLLLQAAAEKFRKKMMIAIPVARGIQRHQEQPRLGAFIQQTPAVRVAHQPITQRRTEPI